LGYKFEAKMKIRKAIIIDLDSIINLIDGEFTQEGYGFVNKAQVETEIYRGSVLVAENSTGILGCRIGIDTVWNIVVTKQARGLGIGHALIDYRRPSTIRVKSEPIGHLSNAQREAFVDPTGFYETLGYKLWGQSLPKNFWQKGRDGKGQFHRVGTNPHIRIFKDGMRLLFD